MHVVWKQLVELDVPDDQEAFKWHQRVSHLVLEKLAPALDQLFDRTVSSHRVQRVDRLAITVSFRNGQLFEQRFTDEVVKALEAELKHHTAGDSTRLSFSGQEHHFKAFLYFLQSGYLPWWAVFSNHEAFQQQVLEALPATTPAERTLSLKAVLQNRAAVQRLVRQFSPDLVQAVMALFTSEQLLTQFKELERIWYAAGYAAQFSSNQIKAFWHRNTIFWIYTIMRPDAAFTDLVNSMLQAALQNNEALITNDFLIELVRRYQKVNPDWSLSVDVLTALSQPSVVSYKRSNLLTSSSEESKTPEKKAAPAPESLQDEESTGVYVSNAGLILLAPFLPMYLEVCGLAKEGLLTNPPEAVHVLQYLVTFRTQTPEYELALNKVLCGLKLTEGVPLEIELTETIRSEAWQVLETVIRYWSALKNASPLGLQESFLQRSGKLTQKANGDWLLQIEQKGYDILLEHLPWNYNMVKLPWMDTLLWVEYS